MWTDLSVFQVGVAVTAVISGSIYFVYRERQSLKSKSTSTRDKRREETKPKPIDLPADLSSGNIPLKNGTPTLIAPQADNVWEERRRRGIPAASLHVKKDTESEKPFGSSYYYAHNSSKTTGGYKDGLRMEDFTMNGPRLLSRTGMTTPNEEIMDASSCSNKTQAAEPTTGTSLSRSASGDLGRRSLNITRYLWDDPGDTAEGIATIRIDDLPGKTSTECVAWKDVTVSIVNISATLIHDNEGLQVKIETSDDVDYLLRIPKLYGDVSEVEAVKKTKRLLIRLTKTKKGMFDKSNLKAWPHPQKSR